VGEKRGPKIVGENAVPGGPSGIPDTPGYATQLAVWLTSDYHKVGMLPFIPPGKADLLVPPPAP